MWPFEGTVSLEMGTEVSNALARTSVFLFTAASKM